MNNRFQQFRAFDLARERAKDELEFLAESFKEMRVSSERDADKAKQDSDDTETSG